VASCSSPSKSEVPSTDPSVLLGPSKIQPPLYKNLLTYLELHLASYPSDFSCNIKSSSKITSMLVRALLVSEISKSETIDSFGESNENASLELGLQFVPPLTINQHIRRAIENL